jgi:hypothetical protein
VALQQALNTVLSVLIASFLAEWADGKLGTGGTQIAQVQLALTVLLGGVFSFALEFIRAVVLDSIPAGRFPRLFKLLGGTLVALALAGCGTTPTDRYYSALTTLAGTREAAIAYCKVPSTPVQQCTAMREAFFVPGDAAVEAMENARLAVIGVCAIDDSGPACKDAGRALSQAAAGVLAVSAGLSRWLAAQGVEP